MPTWKRRTAAAVAACCFLGSFASLSIAVWSGIGGDGLHTDLDAMKYLAGWDRSGGRLAEHVTDYINDRAYSLIYMWVGIALCVLLLRLGRRLAWMASDRTGDVDDNDSKRRKRVIAGFGWIWLILGWLGALRAYNFVLDRYDLRRFYSQGGAVGPDDLSILWLGFSTIVALNVVGLPLLRRLVIRWRPERFWTAIILWCLVVNVALPAATMLADFSENGWLGWHLSRLGY